jgi:hypothetical protein
MGWFDRGVRLFLHSQLPVSAVFMSNDHFKKFENKESAYEYLEYYEFDSVRKEHEYQKRLALEDGDWKLVIQNNNKEPTAVYFELTKS